MYLNTIKITYIHIHTHIYNIHNIYAFMYTQILMVPIFEQGFNLKEAFRSQNLRVDRDWQVHEHELSEDYKTRRNKIAPHQGSQSSSANHATISTYAPTTIYCKSHIHTYIHTYYIHKYSLAPKYSKSTLICLIYVYIHTYYTLQKYIHKYIHT